MSPRANLAVRLAFGLAGWGAFGAPDARAQSAPPPAAATPAVSLSPADLPAAPSYQDRLIEGGALAPDMSAGEGTTSDDSQGLARSLEVDGVFSVLSSTESGSSSSVVENGVIIKSQWESAAYGAWSLDGSARTGGSNLGSSVEGQGGVITLRQRGMPFDGGWQADNTLGDTNTPDVGLAKLQPRFFLPTAPMQGLTTEWRGPEGLQIVAGGGVPGLYDGIEVPDFRTLAGSTATAGLQWSPDAHWTLGGQLIEAHDVNLAVGPIVDADSRMSSGSGLLSAAWQGEGRRLQMNLMDDAITGEPNALGAWIDGTLTQGRFVHNAGLFRLDPNMTWGNQLITNDAEGGYYRFGYQSRQWLSDLGIDEVHSVSGQSANMTFLTGDTRYQIFRDWGVGAVANLAHNSGGNAWSLESYLDHPNRFGTGRVQADYATTAEGRDLTLTLDQGWSSSSALKISTSAYVERISGAMFDGSEQDSTLVGLGAYGGGELTARLGAQGNVRWAHAVSGQAAPGISANVSLTYQVSSHWELLLTYYESRTGSWTPLTVTSPLSPPVPTAVPAIDERGIFLTLRYQRAAGLHFAPLGGAPGAGSGALTGTVYLDANANGQLDAGESGAANLTVVLDGRFSTQTDAAGRFSFPVVAAGHHVLTVSSDNLPLPWVLTQGGRTEIEVGTRAHTDVAIAAERPR
ncbi:MAG TPA: hypothetical protein VKT22_14900 [Steroidobacteraceae bacterium]|nr:hypothetical protein [Steroidobacteraceae bacterium]